MTDLASVFRVIVSCAFVCGLAWALGWTLRRWQPLSGSPKRRLRLLEVLPLGGGKSLALVACDHRHFLLALTPQSIQLLTEVTEGVTGEWRLATGTNGKEERCSQLADLPTANLPIVFLLLLVSFSVAFTQSPTANWQSQLSLTRESVQILLVLTLIALAPFLLSVMTCFTRIVIVLSLLRMALGTPQTPPNPVLIGMALFLTLFVMAPTLQAAYEKGLQPYLQGKLSTEQAIAAGYRPFQRFMLRQVREQDIALFLRIARLPNPKSPEDVPPHILIPAFILSEVRTGFEIGFLLSVPFLVVDIVIASVLMGLGMLMVPPMLISLPLKLLLFVLADGWHLLLRGLALSVR
jgi:flagellar biosynthetic protein FliP